LFPPEPQPQPQPQGHASTSAAAGGVQPTLMTTSPHGGGEPSPPEIFEALLRKQPPPHWRRFSGALPGLEERCAQVKA
jgi:hypothetical protein